MPTLQNSTPKAFTPGAITLPTVRSEGITRIEQVKMLIVAPPGWGKTSLALSNPDTLLLACEEGHKFEGGFKIIIDSWESTAPWIDSDGIQHCSFVDVVAILQKEKKKFSMVTIDTFDALVKMLLDDKLGKKRVEHASDLGEYGKGYDIAQNAPFRKTLNALVKTGRGVIGVTHENVETKQFKTGQRAKKETSLPSGIYKMIFPQFDLILHGIFGKIPKGEKTRDRLLISEGSEDLLAKNRGGFLPPGWVVPRKPEKRWAEFSSFFQDVKARDKAFKEFTEKGYDLD